jgi:hypothetical protein
MTSKVEEKLRELAEAIIEDYKDSVYLVAPFRIEQVNGMTYLLDNYNHTIVASSSIKVIE